MGFKFNLGDRVEDRITGFQGIITGRGEYYNGCINYCLKGRVDKDGKMPEGQWIDEPQLDLIASRVVTWSTEDGGDQQRRVVGGPRADQMPER